MPEESNEESKTSSFLNKSKAIQKKKKGQSDLASRRKLRRLVRLAERDSQDSLSEEYSFTAQFIEQLKHQYPPTVHVQIIPQMKEVKLVEVTEH